MKWIMLLLAGIFEVSWAITMKYSNGFTEMIPSAITIIGYILSAVFLSAALKEFPLGTAYAMWTGFGILGTTVLGVVLFSEKLSPAQVVCVLLIAAGIAGLKILGND